MSAAPPPAADRPPLAVALDTPDLARATAWAAAVRPHVRVLKVGLELFTATGPAAVHAVRGDGAVEVFLDLKLHDIPNTVAGAARAAAALGVRYLTVHAGGGAAMVAAAAEAAPEVTITAVTVLTSLDGAALDAVGLAGPPAEAVLRLGSLAVAAGARALVCSPLEVAALRAAVGPDVELVVPGVRPAGADRGDQARVATPERALADGASLLVLGRPITAAADPAAAAAQIAAGLTASSAAPISAVPTA